LESARFKGRSRVLPENSWVGLRDEVDRRFSLQYSGDESLVEKAMASLDTWMSKPMYAEQWKPILSHILYEQYALLLDSFYQLVPFGTGGRRARIGYGPNRINPITVAMSVQGHCGYLRAAYPSSNRRKIVIAFDTREFTDIAKTYEFLGAENSLLRLTSRVLAHIACEIYAGNGFEVYLAGLNSEREYLSTPELSFAIRRLGALAGMNVSASHNHPDDNGFKFFNEHGAQDVPPTDQEMASYMGEVREISRTPVADAVTAGTVVSLPAELHQEYIRTNLALRSKTKASRAPTVVYTPLCGTGDATVGDVLRAAGYDVRLYEPQANYDGSFASIPLRLPNPEVPDAASPALALARTCGADLVFCTDPDADRLGVFAKDRANHWRYLNGNEIASILAYYLTLDHDIGPRRSGVLIKTLVTTRMIQRIAEKSGCLIVPDLLVGFKYIAHVLLCLEREGRYNGIQASPANLVLAGEESHGILVTPLIRDKDAAGGALILCELVSQLRSKDQCLPEYLDALSLECGSFQNVARGVVMRGIRGAALMKTMMESLRAKPVTHFGDLAVLRVRDLQPGSAENVSDTERHSRNLLVYELEQAQIVIRPSGTEPKAKIYVDVEGAKLKGAPDRKGIVRITRNMAAKVVEECIGRVGFHLSDSANVLPDYVDLDLKADFDSGFRPDLLATAVALSRRSEAEQVQWLKERLDPYGSGADPLRPTAWALRRLFDDLGRQSANPALTEALARLHRTVDHACPPDEWIM
jgi:phosphoglucomutase